MNPLQRAIIEKAGHDNGFEYVMEQSPDSVTLASARHATRAVISSFEGSGFVVHMQTALPHLLPELRRAVGQGWAGTEDVLVTSEAELARFLRCAARLARALPNQAVSDYQQTVTKELAKLTASMAGTEVERFVRQRVGQDRFRDALLDYWGGACAVTGVSIPEVLRASHTKPWADCDSDAERLDVFNGFLLIANLDALFDRFLISFNEAGQLLVSPSLQPIALANLGIHTDMRLRWVTDAHQHYLAFHRACFNGKS